MPCDEHLNATDPKSSCSAVPADGEELPTTRPGTPSWRASSAGSSMLFGAGSNSSMSQTHGTSTGDDSPCRWSAGP